VLYLRVTLPKRNMPHAMICVFWARFEKFSILRVNATFKLFGPFGSLLPLSGKSLRTTLSAAFLTNRAFKVHRIYNDKGKP
jgi:hypothetical protein